MRLLSNSQVIWYKKDMNILNGVFMKFETFSGKIIKLPEVTVVDHLFVYGKYEDKTEVFVNYQTTVHDEDITPVINQPLIKLLPMEIGDLKLTERKVEIGLNFAGTYSLLAELESEGFEIGLTEIGTLIPINKSSFIGKIITNLNPKLILGGTNKLVPILKGKIKANTAFAMTGKFKLNEEIKIKYIRWNWVDYIKIRPIGKEENSSSD